MAFRPSFRRSAEADDVDINLTPIMNLMVVLIPLLLSSAQFIKIGVIDLNLPPAVGAKGITSEAPKEIEKKLDLAITITDRGFFLSSSLAILKGKEENSPSIPILENGNYNFIELSKILFDLKKKALGQFSDTEKIVIQAEPEILYQVLVSTMDAARNIVFEDMQYVLFPDVSLAAGII